MAKVWSTDKDGNEVVKEKEPKKKEPKEPTYSIEVEKKEEKILKQREVVLQMEKGGPDLHKESDSCLEMIDDENSQFLNILKDTFAKYLCSGARSNQKTLVLHTGLKNLIQEQLPGYHVEIEKNVESINSSGRKSCDIVAYKDDIPSIIFPVKNIMTNYYQNKNNSWENLTGEIVHLKKANENIHIIPINIIFNSVPYCKKSKLIKNFEQITYEKTYQITDKLVEWGFASDIINYIIDVNQLCGVKETYDKCPEIIGFNKDTPYRTFESILRPILHPH